MRNEYLVLQEKDLKSQIKDLEYAIHSYFGIVPAAMWNELDRLQMQLINANKVEYK